MPRQSQTQLQIERLTDSLLDERAARREAEEAWYRLEAENRILRARVACLEDRQSEQDRRESLLFQFRPSAS